jgi:purine-nucleoside phosphorylase
MSPNPWEVAATAGEQIRVAAGGDLRLAVVLGSGWAPVADGLGEVVADIDTTSLAGFSAPTVTSHRSRLVVVEVPAGDGEGPPSLVGVLAGRVHLYEGHDVATVVHPVRALAAAGATGIVLTNAAGAIDPSLAVGEPVLVADHLNCTGTSPLRGPEPPHGIPGRFVDLSDLYSAGRRRRLVEAAGPLREAVYAGLPGPHFETPAEIRALGVLGAGLVGFSTVSEAIAARHCGMEVVAISLVTNAAAGLAPEVSAEEVFAAAADAGPRIAALLATVVRTW